MSGSGHVSISSGIPHPGYPGQVLRLPTAAVAAGSLVLGYAVADLTGLRWLGGLVLAVGVALCWQRWRRVVGGGGAVALAGLYVVGFVVVHLITSTLGAWPSVLLVAALVGAACWLLVDRRAPVTTR